MFFLGKTSTIHIELLFRNAPGKVHELAFLWFGLPGRLLIFGGEVPILVFGRSDNRNIASVVRGLLGTDPPDLTLESASPSPPQRSIWHRFDIDSTLIRHRFPDLTLFRCQIDPEEGKARQIQGWGPGGLCLINPSQR